MGTAGDDVVSIDYDPSGSMVLVREADVVRSYSAKAVQSVLFRGLAGNDYADFSSLTKPATMIGGHGDDRLGGGSGNDRLLGGTGNDYIGGVHATTFQRTRWSAERETTSSSR